MGRCSLLPLYSIIELKGCQEVFQLFFRGSSRQTDRRSGLLSLTDKGIVSHPEPEVKHKMQNRIRQNAQLWELKFVQLYAKKCLTNSVGHGIMEISARALAPGPPLYHYKGILSIGKMHKKSG